MISSVTYIYVTFLQPALNTVKVIMQVLTIASIILVDASTTLTCREQAGGKASGNGE